MKIPSIKNTVSGLIFITIFSQALAFVRESIFAYYYGTSLASDAYVMATQIPVTLFAIVSSALNIVILPIYSEKKVQTGDKEAKIFLKSAIIFFSALCIIAVIFAELFVSSVVKLFAPHFTGEVLDITIQYTQIMFPSIVFTMLINIITVCYSAENNFSYPALIALSQNLSIIIAMVLGAKQLGVKAVVFGTVGGIFINMCLLVIPHLEIFVMPMAIRNMWVDLKKVLTRVIPVTIGVGIAEINRIIDRAIASGLDTGSITALNYANRLSVVFSALILSAVTTIAFKRFSELYVLKKVKRRAELLVNYMTLLIMVLIPITIGAIILKKELISVAFGRGAFDLSSVLQTSEIFFYSALGIVFIAVREIMSKYFYSSGDTRTPVINAAIGVLVNIVLNILLSKCMGASGLALATTISNTVVCVLLYFIIIKINKEFPLEIWLGNCIRIVCSSLVMMISIFIANWLIKTNNNWNKILVDLFIGVVSYLIALIIIAPKLLKNTIKMLFEGIKVNNE